MDDLKTILAGRAAFYSKAEFRLDTSAQPLAESDLSLTDIYGAETVARLRDGIAAAPRWGIREGQGVLMTRLYNEFTISIVLQEMLSGYFPPATTLAEAYRRTIALIPDYAFPITLPEETPEP